MQADGKWKLTMREVTGRLALAVIIDPRRKKTLVTRPGLDLYERGRTRTAAMPDILTWEIVVQTSPDSQYY